MVIDVLIAKYLNGESTPEETAEIDKWRKSSPENDLIFRQSEDAWHVANIHQAPIQFDRERNWNNIQKRTIRQYSLPALVRVAGIAASIALMLGLTLTYVYMDNHKNTASEQSQKITFFVPSGVCSKTILSDSTVVWLNSSSMISYPSHFNGNTRTIELMGEAFFDVTRNESKPFIINSGELRVNVLGTSFNFKHYSEDTHAVLAVETGTVTLSAGPSTTTTLQEGKYAIVDNKSLQTKVFNTPPAILSKKNEQSSSTTPKMITNETHTDQFSSWRDYKIIFRDEVFSNVINELSRRYNAEFEIQGEEIKDYVYTATFDDMSLEDVLKLLKLSAPIDYKIKNLTSNEMNAYGKRRVTIFRK